jgi:hypothetical protein
MSILQDLLLTGIFAAFQIVSLILGHDLLPSLIPPLLGASYHGIG